MKDAALQHASRWRRVHRRNFANDAAFGYRMAKQEAEADARHAQAEIRNFRLQAALLEASQDQADR